MKSLNSLRTVEQTQEIVLQNLTTLFARLTQGSKTYRILVPLCGTIYGKPLKKTNDLNTFKHNVKNLYLKQ